MLASRNSNLLNFNALSINYSTMVGSTLVSNSTISTFSTVNSTITANTVFYSTMTGSSISTVAMTASTINANTMSYLTLGGSTTTVAITIQSTIGIGGSYLSTVTSAFSTISLVSSVPQYQLDVTGTVRSASIQYQDNSIVTTAQPTLDYATIGQNWSQAIVPSTAAWTSIALSATGQYQVACINSGNIWYSVNYGKSWTQTATSLAWRAVSCSASGQYMSACVNTGFIWYSTNFGVTWTQAATSLAWSSITMSASGQIQVACVNGESIWYSSNYGQTWTTSGVTNSAWSSVSVSASGQYASACVNGGSIWYSSNYGQTWTTSGVANSAWASVAVSATGKLQSACVTGGFIWFSTNYGQSWTQSGSLSSNWTLVEMDASGQYQIAVTSTTVAPSLSTALYAFSSFAFTPCGAIDRLGPTTLTYPNLIPGYFTVNAGIQQWTVPVTGSYTLVAAGAGGGRSNTSVIGGRGVIVSTTYTLVRGQILYILVGQRGGNGLFNAGQAGSGGGGGGTFILIYNGGAINSSGSYTILLIAGGGGGGGNVGGVQDAVVTTSGTADFSNSYAGGTNGNGGGANTIGNGSASGGAGFLTNGATAWNYATSGPSLSASGGPGISFLNGAAGGYGSAYGNGGNGGFGGGSGGGVNAMWGGGAGGGYSGGGGAALETNARGSGGGGSYDINGTSNNATLNTSYGSAGFNPAGTDGYAIITLVTATTPTAISQLYYSTNYGQTWTTPALQFGPSTFGLSSTGQYLSACVLNGAIYTSQICNQLLTSSGNITSINTLQTGALTYSDGTTVVSGSPVLDYSTFGTTWLPNATAGTRQWNGCAISATGQYMTATANASGLWYSSNYGQTWTQISNATIPTAANISSVAISGSGQYQVAGSTITSHGIYYSSNYGVTWTQASGTTSIIWVQVCVSSSGQYMSACNTNTFIYYSTNYGVTWTASTSTNGNSIAAYYAGIACSASGQYQVARVVSGGIYYSTNYGVTWTISNITNAGGLEYGFGAMSASGQYAIFPSSLGMYVSTNNGQTWALIINGIGSPALLARACMSASGQYQIVSSNSTGATGGVIYSTNYGQTWNTYPIINANGWASTAISANGQFALAGAFLGSLHMSVVKYPAFYTSQLTYPSPFSVAAAGWTTLPGRVTLQWGSFVFSTPQTVSAGTVTFPKAYTSACYSVVVSLSNTGNNSSPYTIYEPMAYSVGTSGFDPYLKPISTATLTNDPITLYWMAYGI